MKKLDPKTDGRSPDLTAENLELLRELFPDVFTEGRIDFDALRLLLGDAVDDTPERYGLAWYGKRRARQAALRPSAGTLRPAPEESVDWDTTQNLVIEGDNLEVLTLLQKSYHRKVKMIYIDPPYNTGNEFIYPDKWQDNLETYLRYTGQVDGEGLKITANAETGGRYHTNWLNMMYPRLKLARNLLRDDGVIFVSIDDHEVHNLRHLMDEVFGGENFVAEIVCSLNPKGRQLGPFFATSHDFLLVYARNVEGCDLVAATTESVNARDFPHSDNRGIYRLLPLRNTNRRFNPQTRPNLYYPLYINQQSGAVSTTTTADAIEVYPVFGSGQPAVWRWGRPKVEAEYDALLGRKVAGRLGTRWDVFQRDYLTEGRTKKVSTVWLSKAVGSTDAAVNELKMLHVSVFETPKPTRLIRRLLQISPKFRAFIGQNSAVIHCRTRGCACVWRHKM